MRLIAGINPRPIKMPVFQQPSILRGAPPRMVYSHSMVAGGLLVMS